MSLLEALKPNKGSTHSKKRIGRGNGSGWGGTAGKGHKGQKARSGAPIRRGFEGGQMPIMRRLPKLGFTNAMFKKDYQLVTLTQLNRFDGEVDLEKLKQAGLIKEGLVKILANGQIEKALKVKVHKMSKQAKSAIEKAGGTFEVIE